jgi:hypothetical protein
MDRSQALRVFEATRRFQSSNGRVLVRDVELAAAIASLKAERGPVNVSGPQSFLVSHAG